MAKIILGAAACLCLATAANAQVYVIKPAQPQIDWSLMQTPDFYGNAMRAQAEGQALAAARQTQAIQAQQAQQAQAQYEAQQTANYEAKRIGDERRARVGGLISQGSCVEARDTALRWGDFDLAKEVDGLCRPTP